MNMPKPFRSDSEEHQLDDHISYFLETLASNLSLDHIIGLNLDSPQNALLLVQELQRRVKRAQKVSTALKKASHHLQTQPTKYELHGESAVSLLT